MVEILSSYSFQIVAWGTAILAAISGMVGCFNLYKGQSLIGDAVGHSSFPGVIIAFMLLQTRDPLLLLFGAILTATISYGFIQISRRHSKVELDASLAIYLSGFFGLGMVLKSIIQGNPSFQKTSQSGLEHYIFGQAAYMMKADVRLIVIISLISLALMLLFYKELKLYVFDPEFARVIGVRRRFVESVLLIMTISLIAVGLKAVGAILISSLMILPCVTAAQWSRKFHVVLIISAGTGIVAALIGTFISSALKGFSTGPTIIVILGIFALLSMAFGRFGSLSRARKRRHVA